MAPVRTVEYFAVSIFSSRTFWFNLANLVLAALSMTEVATLIPPKYLPVQAAVVATINMWLRLYTVRPAAVITPGTSVAVEVPKLAPPKPKPVTD